MLKKWMIAVAFIALGCGDDGDDPSSDGAGKKAQKDASAVSDAGSPTSSDAGRQPDSSKPQDADDASDVEDAGAMSEPDSGAVPASPDGGTFVHGSGSCCEAHTTPGCENADLEVCVCEANKACCTGAWTPDCALIVKQRYCQAGVRECVLDTWKQEQCRLDWTRTCDVTGQQKCGQVPGCF